MTTARQQVARGFGIPLAVVDSVAARVDLSLEQEIRRLRGARDAGVARVTFNQDTWWCNRDGLTLLIDNMDERYRHNCANWLLDRAAMFWVRKVRADEWSFLGSPYMPDDLGFDPEPLTWNDLRKRQDRGEHLDWLRSTPLYQRMVR